MTGSDNRPGLKGWVVHNLPWLLAILGLGLVPFLPTLFNGHILFASDQVGAPGWRFYFDSLRAGEIPLWNPLSFAGMPTFDAMFGDAGYVPFLLLGLIFPPSQLITYNFILHTLLAGLGSYWLLSRNFKLPALLATGLAVAYMLNTNMISHIHAGHTAKFFIMCWLPLSVHCLLRSLSPAARWYHALGLALIIALCVTTSHLQFTYYVLMGFFLIWVWSVVPALKAKQYGRSGGLVLRFWVPILLGIGLAAPMIYPPIQYTKGYGVRGTNEKTTYEHATSWSMHPEEAASLVVPEFGGLNEAYWGRNPFKLNSEYAGIAVLFLGVFGLAAFRGLFFYTYASIGLLAIIFGLGAHTPLFRLFYALIPGIKQFRAPSMMLFWLAMALLLMSAEAIRRLLSEDEGERLESGRRSAIAKRLTSIGYGVAAFTLVCALLPALPYGLWQAMFTPEEIANYATQEAAKSAFTAGGVRAALILAALTFATRTLVLNPRAPKTFGLVLLAVVMVDLVWVNSNFLRHYEPNRFLRHEPAIERLKTDTSEFRVFGVPGAYERWFTGYHGIETADGWTDNEPRVFREYRGNDYQRNPHLMQGLQQAQDGSAFGSTFLDMLNVKYIAFRHPEMPGLQLAPYTSGMPRAYWIGHWESLPDSQQVSAMLAASFNPRRYALVDDRAGLGNRKLEPMNLTTPVDSTSSDSSALQVEPSTVKAMEFVPATRLTRSNNRAEYSIDAPAEGILVLNDLWFPNWQVKVDGKPVELLRVNFAFRGAKVPAGKHTVLFEYHSPWLKTGWLISLGCLVLLLGYVGVQRAYARRA
jgi:Bacterial membrane protein YfhO